MRERLILRVQAGGNYFATPAAGVSFLPSGCKLPDMALGGGWAEGRIGNVVGDKSSGKTLLCIEASANYAVRYSAKEGSIFYREAEAAFDRSYAAALGMPIDRIDFGENQVETVEDFFEDLEDIIKGLKKSKRKGLYVLDSLDSLSDRSELARAIDKGTYGGDKAKKMSQLFRRLAQAMSSVDLTLLIVSQLRDKITDGSFSRPGARTWTRTGGRALDFYASQVVYLAQVGKVVRTIDKVKRTIGVGIRAKMDKNKVGLPFREAEFDIIFGFGVNDVLASLDWLEEVGSLKEAGIAAKDKLDFSRAWMNGKLPPEDIRKIEALVERRWSEVETSFLPTRRKYGD